MSKGIEIVNQALEMLKKGDFETYETLLVITCISK